MNIIKRGDVFFCLGSPDAVGSEERKTRPVVVIQNDAGHALSRVQCEQIRTVDKCRLREKVYTLTEDELRKLDACLAVSFGMTRQNAQEGPQSAPKGQDDIFLDLARKGLSVAVCPLPVLNQVNITVTDGKAVAITRNVAPTVGGIVSEIQDMKNAVKEVTT